MALKTFPSQGRPWELLLSQEALDSSSNLNGAETASSENLPMSVQPASTLVSAFPGLNQGERQSQGTRFPPMGLSNGNSGLV